MTYEQALRMRPGDEVRWTDPDGGTCSRTLTILTVEVVGDAFRITEDDGSVLECYPEELLWRSTKSG